MKKNQTLTASELLELLGKQWANVNDIKLIGEVGTNRAQIIKKEIKENLENQGYRLPRGLVPMEAVVEYFKINIEYLKKFTKK